MNIFKEPYTPGRVRTSGRWQDRSDIAETTMYIQTDNTEVNPNSLGPAIAMLVATIGISFAWWPILFLNIIALAIWTVFPATRPIWRERVGYQIQRFGKTRGPEVNWDLYNKNSLYQDAVKEWLEAVRSSDNLMVNWSQWNKYLTRMERLAKGPDQEKVLVPNMEYLMQLEKAMGELR